MVDYDNLERPVVNESHALTVRFGITLQQIIDVVRHMAKVHSSTELYSRCHLCDYQSEASFGVKHHIKR